MFYSIFFSVCIYTSGSSLLDAVFLFLSMFLVSCKHKWFWTLNVGRTASYENHSCPSVCLSVRLSLSFLRIGSLVFSDIVHNDNWSWYLVTDGARFLKKKKKKIGDPNLGQMGRDRAQNKFFFCHFLKFGSSVFLYIT